MNAIVGFLAWLAVGAALLAALPTFFDGILRLRYSKSKLHGIIDYLSTHEFAFPASVRGEGADSEAQRREVWTQLKTTIGSYPSSYFVGPRFGEPLRLILERYSRKDEPKPADNAKSEGAANPPQQEASLTPEEEAAKRRQTLLQKAADSRMSKIPERDPLIRDQMALKEIALRLQANTGTLDEENLKNIARLAGFSDDVVQRVIKTLK